MQSIDYIIPKMNKYVRIVNDGTNKRLNPLGIYTGQWSVILALTEIGNVTQSELMQYLSIEAPTLTKMINRLEDAGLVTRTACADGRAKKVSLTEEAKDKFLLWDNEIKEYRKQLFRGFSDEEMVVLHQLFDRLVSNVTSK